MRQWIKNYDEISRFWKNPEQQQKNGIELKSSAKDIILKDLPGKFSNLVNNLFKVQRLPFVVIF